MSLLILNLKNICYSDEEVMGCKQEVVILLPQKIALPKAISTNRTKSLYSIKWILTLLRENFARKISFENPMIEEFNLATIS